MSEKRGEPDTIVSGPGLFAKRDNFPLALRVELDQSLAESLTDHAVADDDHRSLFRSIWGCLDHALIPRVLRRGSGKFDRFGSGDACGSNSSLKFTFSFRLKRDGERQERDGRNRGAQQK